MRGRLSFVPHWMLFVAVIIPVTVFSQITVTSNDILSVLNKTQSLEFDSSESVTVDVGTPGGSKTWDFRTLPLQSVQQAVEFLPPQSTPYASNFPTANMAQKVSFDFSGQTFESYGYLEISSTRMRDVGSVSNFFGMTQIDTSSSIFAPLPITFGATWRDTRVTRDENFGITNLDSSVTSSIVDAWGTVRVPAGDFQCLRICEFDTSYSQTIVGGFVISSDTTITITYTWVTKNNLAAASATSQDGETNPNFTDASSFFRLGTGVPTVVDSPDGGQLQASFELAQNFPNPFNPETSIQFSLGANGFVELAVFDASGKLVKNLLAQELSAGHHEVRWDGTDSSGLKVASGHYLYRLSTNGEIKSKVMALVK